MQVFSRITRILGWVSCSQLPHSGVDCTTGHPPRRKGATSLHRQHHESIHGEQSSILSEAEMWKLGVDKMASRLAALGSSSLSRAELQALSAYAKESVREQLSSKSSLRKQTRQDPIDTAAKEINDKEQQEQAAGEDADATGTVKTSGSAEASASPSTIDRTELTPLQRARLAAGEEDIGLDDTKKKQKTVGIPRRSNKGELPMFWKTLCWKPVKHAGDGGGRVDAKDPSEQNKPMNYEGWCKSWTLCVKEKADCAPQAKFEAGGACSSAVKNVWSPPPCDRWCAYHDQGFGSKEGEEVQEKKEDVVDSNKSAFLQVMKNNSKKKQKNATTIHEDPVVTEGGKAACMENCEALQQNVADCVAESMFYPQQLQEEKETSPFSFGVKTGGCYMSLHGTRQAMDPTKITGKFMSSDPLEGAGQTCNLYAPLRDAAEINTVPDVL